MPGDADRLAPTSGSERGGLLLAPFRGVRYSPAAVGDLGSVTSPPYDLIDERGARRLAEADPYNVVRLILPGDDARSRAERYAQARRTLRAWLADGVLVADPRPALYVYEQRIVPGAGQGAGRRVQRGLLGGLELMPPEAGVVLPHEDVLPGPVADRLALMRATAANLEPIFCVYDGGGAASDLVDDVAAGATASAQLTTDDGVTHRLWAVTDPARHAAVAADLRGRQALIADGHHRYATYLRLRAEYRAAEKRPGPWDYGLALLVDSRRYPPRLDAIHRVIPGLDPAEALRRVSRVCRVSPVGGDLDSCLADLAEASRRGPAFVLAGNGRRHLVTEPDPAEAERALPTGRSTQWRRLATAALHYLVIPRVWGIGRPEAVRFVHHDAAAAVAAAAEAGGTAALLAPPSTEDVLAIAARGERVPHKSTSFGPKPRTGLVLRTFAVE